MPTNAADPLVSLAKELSDRLCSWHAVLTDLERPGDPFTQTPVAVVRMEIRPEFAGRVDIANDLFVQENAVLIQLERDAGRAFRWDEGVYAEPHLLGALGVSHYLIDTERNDVLQSAIRRHPPMSTAERARAAAEFPGVG